MLVLARYRHVLKDYRPLRKRYPALHMAFKTVHASKGLEAEYVLLVGLHAGKYGFPTEIVDDPLLDLVLSTPERHSNAEERRLFYVALTRAKRQVYLVADGGRPSPFAEELLHGGYDIALFGLPPAPHVTCPLCAKGVLQPRKRPGQNEIFYGCSNYPYCHHTAPACPACKTGLPIRTGHGMACPNCGNALLPCPQCTGWLLERTGKNRSFLGCINYPACKYTRPLDPSAADAPPRARSTPATTPDDTRPAPLTVTADPELASAPPPRIPAIPSHTANPTSPAPTTASPAAQMPSPPTHPDAPNRVGDAVTFETGTQTVHGHIADYPPSRRFATVIDIANSIWKVDKKHLTREPGRARRNIIITPANEARAALKVGEFATFTTRNGPKTGQILKLNSSRAQVETGDSVWTIPYELFTPISAEDAERRRRLHTVAATARELMDLHGLSDWALVYGESQRRLGLCKHKDQLIRIALHHALDDEDHDIRDTVLHEIAHALAGPGHGHGARWKEIAARIGASPASAKQTKSVSTLVLDTNEPDITM